MHRKKTPKSEVLTLPFQVKLQSKFFKNSLLEEVLLVQILLPTFSQSQDGLIPESVDINSTNSSQMGLIGMIKDPVTPNISCVKFNNSGCYLAESCSDSCIYVWMVALKMPGKSGICTKSNNREMHSTTIFYNEKGIKKSSVISFSLDDSLFATSPFRVWKGHTSPVKNFCWSTNDFLASSSGDNIIRIWHLDKDECLCCFSHESESITAIAFHPSDDRYLLATSSDKKIRMWSLEDKKVIAWNETTTKGYFTAVSFTPDATMCAAGTSGGGIVFYEIPSLKYHTQIASVKKSSAKVVVNGIEYMKSSLDDENRLLATTTDSSIRVYNIRDKSLYMKCKGFVCTDSPICATTFINSVIVSPSEDGYIYFWDTHPPEPSSEDPAKLTDKKQSNSFKVFSSLKFPIFGQAPRLLIPGESFLNWERFKLPKCTEGGIPSVAITSAYKSTDHHQIGSPSSSLKPRSPSQKRLEFIAAVSVGDVVYVYINRQRSTSY